MVSPVTVRHRLQLDLVGDVVERRTGELIASPEVGDIDRWWAGVVDDLVDTIRRGFDTAAPLGARYVATHGLVEESAQIEETTVGLDTDRVVTSLTVVGPVAFKKNLARTESIEQATRVMRTRTLGSARRLTSLGFRGSAMATIQRNDVIAGWQRVARPGACDFCSELAGRGAVYKTELRAGGAGQSGRIRGKRKVGESYHDSCRCVPEPVYR